MKIEDIKRAVQGKKIILNNKLIALKTFGRLLSFLKIDSILFENAEVADIEMGVSILGKASFGSFQFKDSECCIYKNEQIESGYEIEWYGKMASIQLSKLNLPGISSFSRFSKK